MRLVIIADDFTGALDVGVQFAPYNAVIRIAIGQNMDESVFRQQDVDVLVVDAETRHQSPENAAASVARLVRLAKAEKIENLYLKTDSGLRGNVGATLAAALEASGETFLAFAPAFPDMQRPTLNGIQYNGGVPIHESPFGQDPFEPVRTSKVEDLFQEQRAKVRSYARAAQYVTSVTAPTIGIFDVLSNEDLEQIGQHLQRQGQLGLLAGCAAFAAVLPNLMGMSGRHVDCRLPGKPLLVLCGSLNPITRRQLDAAAAHGFKRVTLAQPRTLVPRYLDSAEGKSLLDTLAGVLDGETHVILETAEIDAATAEKLRQSDEVGKQEISMTIANWLGEILNRLLKRQLSEQYIPMIIGGDTLMGIMRHLFTPDITVEREIEPGVVMFSIVFTGRTMWMISKSGGFGDEELLIRMAEKTRQRSE